MVSIGLSSQKINLAGYKVPVVYLVGAAGIAIIGYFLLSQKKGQMGAGGGGMPPLVAIAPDVVFTTNPSNISPPNPFTILGQFQTAQGQPVTVKQGYYYVFMVDSVGGKRLISQGSVGIMVSRFNVPVQTTGWQAGKYSVVVTDVPMSPQELQASQPQATVSGGTYGTTTAPVIGAQPQPPLQPMVSNVQGPQRY